MRILVFSDSHGDVAVMDRVIAAEPHDMLVHCGDFTVSKSLIEARFDHWVDGNNDYPETRPEENFQIGRFSFNVQHGHMLPLYSMKAVAKKMKKRRVDVLLFGHTHIPCNMELDKVKMFNPGSCTSPRSDSGKTYGIVHINNDEIRFEVKKI